MRTRLHRVLVQDFAHLAHEHTVAQDGKYLATSTAAIPSGEEGDMRDAST